MSEKQTQTPLRTVGRRLAVGVDRVVGLPGRVVLALATLGQRAAEAGLVPALLATVIGLWLVVCWYAVAGTTPWSG